MSHLSLSKGLPDPTAVGRKECWWLESLMLGMPEAPSPDTRPPLHTHPHSADHRVPESVTNLLLHLLALTIIPADGAFGQYGVLITAYSPAPNSPAREWGVGGLVLMWRGMRQLLELSSSLTEPLSTHVCPYWVAPV